MTNHRFKPFPNDRAAVLFVLGFLLGGVAWFKVFSVAMFDGDEALRVAAIWWFTGAAVVSALLAACQPATRLFWSLGFAAPIVGWCGLSTLYVVSDTRFLWWTALGAVTAAIALVGAVAGRTLARRLR
jgi:hypothetical protein